MVAARHDTEAMAGRVEQLVAWFDTAADPGIREKASELVAVLMQLYGAGLARIIQLVQQADGDEGAMLQKLVRDELVASLLVLHDLHPEVDYAQVEQHISVAPESLVQLTTAPVRGQQRDGRTA